MRPREAFRQGDVLLVRAGRLPERTRVVAGESGRLVLADGEMTGHAHAVEGQSVRLLERRPTHPIEARLTHQGRIAGRFLLVGRAGATLVHEEHDPIAIPPGTYEVRRQREYDPLAAGRARRIAD